VPCRRAATKRITPAAAPLRVVPGPVASFVGSRRRAPGTVSSHLRGSHPAQGATRQEPSRGQTPCIGFVRPSVRILNVPSGYASGSSLAPSSPLTPVAAGRPRCGRCRSALVVCAHIYYALLDEHEWEEWYNSTNHFSAGPPRYRSISMFLHPASNVSR
jgi:hypothetical protein